MPYVYEVSAINYFNLSEPERNSVLAAFAAALQQLSSAVVFHVKDMGEGSIIDMTDEVRIGIEPLERDESKGLIRAHADILQAKLTIIEIAGGRDRELWQEAVMAEEAAQSVISGAQKLFRVSCVLILRERNLDALRKKADNFWDAVMGVVTELDSPKEIQQIMVSGNGPRHLRGSNLLMPTDSVLAFFPFAGLDIIEHNGIFLGTNTMTKGPIIYDIYRKGNPHLLVVGKSGLGKSMLLKSWVSRMAITHPDLAFMVFDSVKDSEYGK